MKLAIALFTCGLATTALAEAPARPVTIVLVHGAFADGSSWDKVTPILQDKGYNVVAVYDPMSSLADDVAATRRVIDAQPGRVAAWHTKPTWYLRAESDRMIAPEAQAGMAKRANAKLTSVKASHVVMLSKPKEVAATILAAAEAARHP